MENDHLHDIFEIVKERKSSGRDIIQLNVGEPEIDPPATSINVITNSLKNKRYKYGSARGDNRFISALATEHGVAQKNVIVGPGSKFLIHAYLKSIITSPSDEVVIPTPSWSSYSLMLKDLGVKKVNYLNTRLESRWQFSIDQLENLINKNTNCVILTNPNNPTSTLLEKDLINQVLALAKEKGFNVLVDGAYKDLVFDEKDQIKADFKDLSRAAYAFTFSKRFSMTGFRLGYLVANEPMIEKIKEYNQITITNVPLFIQDAGFAALKESESFTEKMRKVYSKRVGIVCQLLTESGIEFVQPRSGFYIFPKINQDSVKFAYDLLEKGVAVVPGSSFGPYDEFIRISLTESEPRLITGVKTILQNL